MVGVAKVLTHTAKLHTIHRRVGAGQVTGLALVHTSIVVPSLFVLFSVLGRIKRKDRETCHLAVSAVDREIRHSRFLCAVRSMVAQTAGALLFGRIKVEGLTASGAVNHVGTHVLSLSL